MKIPKIILLFALILISCGESKKIEEEVTKHRKDLRDIVERIGNDFSRIKEETGELASEITELYLNRKSAISNVDKTKYELSFSGVFYKPVNDGKSATYLSNRNKPDEKLKNIVYLTEPAEEKFIKISKKYPEIVQVYYNERHSLCRIYPYFDVLNQLDPGLDLREFNFYYLADKKHNPGRNTVWIDEPYIDPAGRGWLVSSISPVYVKNNLEGVAGIDITINTITEKYVHQIEDILIADKKGVIITASEYLIQLFSMPPLRDHKYLETINLDTFRRDSYNILLSSREDLREAVKALYLKSDEYRLVKSGDTDLLIIIEMIPDLKWRVIGVFDLEKI